MTNCVFADRQCGCNLLVCRSVSNQFKNLQLTRSKTGPRHPIRKPCRDVTRNEALSGEDFAYRGQHLNLGGVLEQISLCAGTNRTINVLVLLKPCENDYLRGSFDPFERR